MEHLHEGGDGGAVPVAVAGLEVEVGGGAAGALAGLLGGEELGAEGVGELEGAARPWAAQRTQSRKTRAWSRSQSWRQRSQPAGEAQNGDA